MSKIRRLQCPRCPQRRRNVMTLAPRGKTGVLCRCRACGHEWVCRSVAGRAVRERMDAALAESFAAWARKMEKRVETYEGDFGTIRFIRHEGFRV